jgi:hypothetical protein
MGGTPSQRIFCVTVTSIKASIYHMQQQPKYNARASCCKHFTGKRLAPSVHSGVEK